MPNTISNTSPTLYFYRIGELAAVALAFENPTHIILLDELLARRTAQAAGLSVWATLKTLVESKSRGLIDKIEPFFIRLDDHGMWILADLKRPILKLAGECSGHF